VAIKSRRHKDVRIGRSWGAGGRFGIGRKRGCDAGAAGQQSVIVEAEQRSRGTPKKEKKENKSPPLFFSDNGFSACFLGLFEPCVLAGLFGFFNGAAFI